MLNRKRAKNKRRDDQDHVSRKKLSSLHRVFRNASYTLLTTLWLLWKAFYPRLEEAAKHDWFLSVGDSRSFGCTTKFNCSSFLLVTKQLKRKKRDWELAVSSFSSWISDQHVHSNQFLLYHSLFAWKRLQEWWSELTFSRCKDRIRDCFLCSISDWDNVENNDSRSQERNTASRNSVTGKRNREKIIHSCLFNHHQFQMNSHEAEGSSSFLFSHPWFRHPKKREKSHPRHLLSSLMQRHWLTKL
jgi:hypothetical protein